MEPKVVATALPAIRLHLHASLAALEWTVNAYTPPRRNSPAASAPRWAPARAWPLAGAAAALVIPGKRRPVRDEPQVPITPGVVETRR